MFLTKWQINGDNKTLYYIHMDHYIFVEKIINLEPAYG